MANVCDYKSFYASATETLSWRNYYNTAGEILPLYYNGDRLGFISYNYDFLFSILYMISRFTGKSSFHIFFLDNLRLPKIRASYMEEKSFLVIDRMLN